METVHWFVLLGALMLVRGMTATLLSRLPVTSAIVYLGVGLLLGPAGLALFHFDPLAQAGLLETLTEIAVLISLFSAGVKMPVPIRWPRWRPAVRLAWLAMSMNVGLVALFAHLVLDMPVGAGVLLGAILAPTDPVLATDVQVRHADDRDELRFTLTCEAGMNDGAAFPFVMLGLGLLGVHDLGAHGLRWIGVEVLWATLGAVAIGLVGGHLVARLGWWLRGREPKHEVLDDLVGLGLIALVYGVAVLCLAWGFLAVFFAGVALRHSELKLAGAHQDRQGLLVADQEDAAGPDATSLVCAESLVFKEHLERLSELMLVLLLGGMISLHDWSWQHIVTALFLFTVARPTSVLLSLVGTGVPLRVRVISAWFGVRGIGSLYYLMFAITHGLPQPLAHQLSQLTIATIALSILLHGFSVKPVLDRFWPTGEA